MAFPDGGVHVTNTSVIKQQTARWGLAALLVLAACKAEQTADPDADHQVQTTAPETAGVGGTGGVETAGTGGAAGTNGTAGTAGSGGKTDSLVDSGVEPVCLELVEACESADQCCSGACGETYAGQVCCSEAGGSCKTANGEDCCGTLECVDGTCTAPERVVLELDFEVQENGYFCGPAATRNALSAVMTDLPSQDELAIELPTTQNGTDWIGQVTETLNEYLGEEIYATTEMPADPPTQIDRDRLWEDLRRSIDAGYPVVANIVAPPSNHPPGYPDDDTIYHYFVVAGYDTTTDEVFIADSASFSGNTLYWIPLQQLGELIPPKGYSAAQ